VTAWTSAHKGKLGRLTPLEKWMKNLKAKTYKEEQFSMSVLYFENHQGRQVHHNVIEITQRTCMKNTYTSSQYKCQLQGKKTPVNKRTLKNIKFAPC